VDCSHRVRDCKTPFPDYFERKGFFPPLGPPRCPCGGLSVGAFSKTRVSAYATGTNPSKRTSARGQSRTGARIGTSLAGKGIAEARS